MPQTWIIIVGFRNAAEVVTCLAALREQTFRSWGVIVCENGGPRAFDDLATALQLGNCISSQQGHPLIDARCDASLSGASPCILLRATHNLGYAGAINASLSEIGCDETWQFVWILNPDTEADPNALQALVAKARSGHYGIVGSRLVYKDTSLVQAYGGVWRPLTARGRSLGRSRPADNPTEEASIEAHMDYILGASMLVTRSYIRDIGQMDDRYFLYCEEVDWCLRRQSYKLGYAHASVVLHTQGTTIGSKGSPQVRSRLAIYLDERNRLLIARRFFPWRYTLIILVTAVCLGRYVKDAAWSNFLVALSGWWAGVLGRSGVPGRFLHPDLQE